MIKWIMCLLLGHKTVHKAMTGAYQTINQLTGLPQVGHYYKWQITPFCTRCGKSPNLRDVAAIEAIKREEREACMAICHTRMIEHQKNDSSHAAWEASSIYLLIEARSNNREGKS